MAEPIKGVCVLGATGSIGVSTLDVVARHPERYRVVALTANRQVERLQQQCLEHSPRFAVMVDENAAEQLRQGLQQLGSATEVLSGGEGLEYVASLDEVDTVMAAIVGAAGLPPTLAAARHGKRVLLANKEALVMSGQLFMDEVHQHGAKLLPIDSEHNAIFQCMPVDFEQGLPQVGVRRILLTASGGPFRSTPLEQLAAVTPEQAVAHPNWSMGRKISVDSATMMNKGLEVIEACWLFKTTPANIQVVLHPQSVIHSMVEYADGSVLAQLGNPDMRTPIAHALAWPERIDSGVPSLDMFSVARLDFEEPDLQRFPCLRLSMEAMERGGTAPTILNAANEIAVEAFLDQRIGFTAIPEIIETTLTRLPANPADSLARIFDDDAAARAVAGEVVAGVRKP
ncbi:MAG: 1-deoxy-D-xylulose-5-phosphate reductoisomerase [Gammaproteobacteria bacterium]|nr:1-deoxy-D-xylulose-5-phosphate reductoisomerase [Gammaproteobacteria bacterium]MCW8840687.1 1-deoxy-D-xylulose-5-phosphate reductoisomerase [Gammaproteobacteria bacterium]MCW8927670.1 1-deoxy-D-xylulose-5-phosphate reductoisomerase [Gammaproteobacteria bacterium]MCW8959052.1 1-deoxy-D-xylulose-5-phosphate reductoisomerase [Gammaproteobacteria bacterium]MCW8973143.1 1-deoxy-D-xylulose-5-phosphate reductoisomerase [Gammaproteobacteria bacterium]